MKASDCDSPIPIDISSQRAKARWAMLRSALLSTKSPPKDKLSSNRHSIHRFTFQILERNLIDAKPLRNHQKCDLHDKSGFEYVEYTVPLGGNISKELSTSQVKIYTKERKISEKVHIDELLSHHKFGVDNTGNKRVWDCSSVLAYLILGNSNENDTAKDFDQEKAFHVFHDAGLSFSKESPFIGIDKILSLAQPFKQNASKISLKILELGAGMCGLPSLSLVALDRIFRQSKDDKFPYINVTITDGHPQTISNNQVCLELSDCMCNQTLNNTTHVQHLIWKSNPDGAQECLDMMKKTSMNYHSDIHYDLCLVSDCVHFTDFHADLAITIGRTIRVGGVSILLQPCRGKSLKQFCDLIDDFNAVETPLFNMKIHLDYSSKISEIHVSSSTNDDYDANIHFPLLLVLTKLRSYDEAIDTKTFLKFVNLR